MISTAVPGICQNHPRDPLVRTKSLSSLQGRIPATLQSEKTKSNTVLHMQNLFSSNIFPKVQQSTLAKEGNGNSVLVGQVG